MNALVKKEIRLLFPSWAIGLVMVGSACLWADHQHSTSWFRVYALFALPFIFGPAMVVMMTLNSFGHELSAGTFSHLLAQPISRTRIWWTKTLLLAAAVLSLWAAWWLALAFNRNSPMDPEDFRDILVTTIVFMLVAYSGGLWTVLIFRQVAAAFWFTLLVPAALAMVTVYFTEKHGGDTAIWLIAILTPYSVAGFFWARRLFLRAQDVHWTGGEIAMPGWLKLPPLFRATTPVQGRRPRLALMRKELLLHQSQLVIAGGLALLHLGLIVVRRANDGFKDSPNLEFVAETIWVLWLLMPLLIGCAAVAEERRLGTLEGQLCQPARRRSQFVIKFAVAVALSIFFSLIVPLLFEGNRILPDITYSLSDDLQNFSGRIPPGNLLLLILGMIETASPVVPFLPFVIGGSLLAGISFYASTLTRNTLQAIAPAFLGIIIALGMLLGAVNLDSVVHYPPWRGFLIYLIGVPVLATTLAWLAYWNFKHALVGWPIWRHNAIVFLTALAAVMALTSLIYQRAWELLMRSEPSHGAARLTRAEGSLFGSSGANLSVRLPDGRAWTGRYIPQIRSLGAALVGDWEAVPIFSGGRFLEETNWTSLTFFQRDVAIVKTDGSLWVSEQLEAAKDYWKPRSGTNSEPIKLVRLGSENDWKTVAGEFALKTNGTLWQLGGSFKEGHRNWQGFPEFDLVRLGADSDWADLSSVSRNGIVLHKNDGRAWVNHRSSGDTKPEILQLAEKITLYRASLQDGKMWRDLAWFYGHRLNSFQVGVHNDGTFRVCNSWRLPPDQTSGQMEDVRTDVQLGNDTNWLAIAGEGEVVVTLKSDGSLWRWDFLEDPVTKPETARATRLGPHLDWIAAVGYYPGIISLAADGSLWNWRFDISGSMVSELRLPPLIAPSRKPQFIGNVFGNAEQSAAHAE